MNDRSLPVGILAGITIATIGLESSVLAVPQPASMLVAQIACKVSSRISMVAVFKTANSQNPEVLGLIRAGTLVGLAETLPTNPPERIQITEPTNGFVAFAALDCGVNPVPQDPSVKPSPQTSSKTTACRKVRNNVFSINVFREPRWGSPSIASVPANDRVFVTQTGGVTTSQIDVNGDPWVEVDLQGTFGKNFGIPSKVGWLPNTNPNDPSTSTLVNGCP